MDVLSEALERVEYRAGVPGTAQLSAPWGFFQPLDGDPVPPTDGLPEELVEFLPLTRLSFAYFYIVAEGRCLLQLAGAEPLELSSGDLVMLTPLSEHQVIDSASTPARPLSDFIPVTSMPHGPKLRIDGGGSRTTLVFGGIVLRGYVGRQLLDSLPPLLHLSRRLDPGLSAWLPQILQLIQTESEQIGAGSMAVLNRLVQVLFCQAVRHHVRQSVRFNGNGNGSANWFQASLDRQIGPALSAIHERMGQPWTVESIAAKVAMSRSAFASRFTSLVGSPPLQYLTNIRMERACNLLASTATPVKQISHQIGYASEAAFSTAFRRQFSMPPIDFRRKTRNRTECRGLKTG